MLATMLIKRETVNLIDGFRNSSLNGDDCGTYLDPVVDVLHPVIDATLGVVNRHDSAMKVKLPGDLRKPKNILNVSPCKIHVYC